MKKPPILLFAHSLLCGGVCLLLLAPAPGPNSLILGVLGLACLLGLRLLLLLSGKLPAVALVLLVGAFATAAAFGSGMFPFLAVLCVLFARQLGVGRSPLVLAGSAILLLGVISQPVFTRWLLMLLCVVPLFFLDDAFAHLAAAHEQMAQRAEEIGRLRQQLTGQRKMATALEHATRLSERNRLAARIHDEVGHGVSGSILLLEGARLAMNKDPAAAGAALEAATENLRAAVDDIRAALRQERPPPGETGLAKISALLRGFEAQHPAIHTALGTCGELEDISPQVWVCVQENLTETLTNILKHSNARHFSVHISTQNGLVKVRFADDGKAAGFTKGLGLAAMEERCALCHGNCFFSAGPQGFSTVMTFTHYRMP